jgi:aspartate racemase
MKVIGFIGGLSWRSSIEYYRIANETIAERLGGSHSAKTIMYSVDFDEVVKLQHCGKWAEISELITNAAKALEKAGADCIVICTNTIHKISDEVQKSVGIPLLHIADATAEVMKRKGLKKIGLLGTKFTMEESFYKDRLNRCGFEVVVPSKTEIQMIHDVIYNELCLGKIRRSSKERFRSVIANLVKHGAQGVVLGCTEIPLLIKQSDSNIPLFDTTAIHIKAAVDYALG